MPEGPEVETEKLHEAIDEELEHGGGNLVKAIALTTAIFAAIAAVAALKAGGSANEALMLETEATRLQALASDQWAYYQAKGIKAELQAAAQTAWLSAGKAAPPQYADAQKKYTAQQAEISAKAKEIEGERDAKAKEAQELLHKHEHFAGSVALFQVAIALGAIAALTRNRWIWFASLIPGIGGAVLFFLTLR